MKILISNDKLFVFKKKKCLDYKTIENNVKIFRSVNKNDRNIKIYYKKTYTNTDSQFKDLFSEFAK